MNGKELLDRIVDVVLAYKPKKKNRRSLAEKEFLLASIDIKIEPYL